MKFAAALLVYMLVVILQKNTFCQDPFYYNYSFNNGLPSTNVYYAFQDSKGYMWFGTDAGVSKYDGYTFKNYTTESGLADNEVFQIHEDSKDRLWFSTMNGKLCFLDSVFHTSDNDSLLKNTSLNYPILSFLETKDGSIIHGSSKGGAVKLNKNKVVRNKNQNPYHYLWEQSGYIYAINSLGIIELDNSFTNYEIVDSKVLGPYANRGIKVGDTIYFGQEDSIYMIDNKKIKPWFALPPGEQITFLAHHRTNALWVGTRSGVFVIRMDAKPNSFKKFFNGKLVTSAFEDREGNVWVTTFGNGIYFIPSPNVILLKDGQSDIQLKVTKDKKNNLWISKPKNNYTVYYSSGELQNYRLEDNRDQQVSYIRVLDEYGIWVTGKENILQILNKDKLFFPYWANDVLIDDAKNLWIASSNVVRLPYKIWANMLVPISDLKRSKLKGPEEIILKNVVVASRGNLLCKGQEGNIWIGTDNGLYKSIQGPLKKLSEKDKILTGKIFDMKYNAEDKELLVATQEQGVAIIKDDRINFLDTKKGLLSNVCISVAKDEKGGIWIATSKGLNKAAVNDTGFFIQDFSSILGLRAGKINNIQADGDTVYLATDDGLLYFNSSKTPAAIPPLFRIDSFLLRDKSIDFKKSHVFDYDSNALSFKYTGFSFRDQGNVTYSYMLEGYDLSWQKTTMREIQYNALAPGNYTFKIFAVSGSGVSSEVPEVVSFIIQPPFWEKWWFRALAIIFISAIIYLFWRRRIKYIRHKFELKQRAIELEKEKMKIQRDLVSIEQKVLRLQMNPHFIFNALNTIKGYYAENNTQQASEYIGKFSKLIRFILENTDSLIPLKTEVEILRLYLEMAQIRYIGKFEFNISIAPALNQSEIAIPPMLLQPFVENAIIHGLAPKEEKGMLSVQFESENNYLVCTVIDNGIGLKAAAEKNKNKEHNSLATQITQERLALYEAEEEKKCTLEIQELTEGSGGTKVEIKLPIKNTWN